jgi:membrane protease YdiL (CAAX protease family)
MTAANAPLQPAAPRQSALARHPLVSYFVMAYAFSWLVWSPWLLSEAGVGLLPYKLGPQAAGLLVAAAILLGPTLSAFIMTALTEGRPGIRRLLGRYVLWRVGLRWYVFALIGIPAIFVLGTIAFSGDLPNFGALGGPSYVLSYLASFVLTFIFGGALLEEPGWRGFALPRLQRLQGPLIGTLILGVLWGLWHMPLFLSRSWAASSGGGGFLGVVWFVVSAILLAIVITWVFNNTQGSLLLAMLVHASGDTFSDTMGKIFPARVAASSLPDVIGLGVVAVVLIALTRGRLGYRQNTDAAVAPRIR